ncbi:hypothetical protein NXH76_14345 [Blautia schinkii]|nr:hypothetical protein [Blautia schinkii]
MKYMQEWEERELERRDAREEGIEMGVEMGQELKLKELIKKKLSKGKTLEVIAEELEESVDTIRKLAGD